MLRHDDAASERAALQTGAGLVAGIAHVHPDMGKDQQVDLYSTLPRISGHYRILSTIGQGGMGIVYQAEQTVPRRLVALKAIRPGLLSRAILRRFVHEAHILGRLQHPGIAQVYEAGVLEDADNEQAFIVMEYVPGATLTEHVAARNLPLRERVELFIKVCDAVHHAHQRGVIHRDLKPTNILVTPDGEPKILDFGVALTQGEADGTTMHTAVGQIIGTLGYMSPEQLKADPTQIDAASDVYTLGVLLYEILAGVQPFNIKGQTLAAAAVMIAREAPLRLGRLNRQCRGDLENIVRVAMHIDRSRRYASADALADDLRRYLDGRPLAARRDSSVYVVSKLVQRHWMLATAAAVLLVALVVFSIVSASMARRNRLLATSESELRQAVTRDADNLRRSLYASNVGYAQAALAIGDTTRAARLLAECPEDLRGWEWRYYSSLTDKSIAQIPVGNNDDVWAAVTPDRTRMLAAGIHGTLMLIDLTTKQPIWRRFEGSHTECTINRDASVGVTINHAQMYFVDLRTGEALGSHTGLPTNIPGGVRCARFNPRDDSLLAASHTGMVYCYDAENYKETASFKAHDLPIVAATISPDGTTFATADSNGGVRVWTSANRAIIAEHAFAPTYAFNLAFSPDNAAIACTLHNGDIALWRYQTSDPVVTLKVNTRSVLHADFTPDGRSLVTGGIDKVLRTWDLATNQLRNEQQGESYHVRFCAYTADPGVIVTTGAYGPIRFWNAVPTPDIIRSHADAGPLALLSVDPERSCLYAATLAGEAARFDLQSLELLSRTQSDADPVRRIASGPPGLVTCTASGVVTLLHPESLQRVRLLDDGIGAESIAMCGSLLAIGCADGAVYVHDLNTNALPMKIDAHQSRVTDLCFSRDARTLFTCGVDHRIRAWTGGDWSRMTFDADLGQEAYAIALSPDESLVASAGNIGAARIWRANDHKEVCALSDAVGPILDVAFIDNTRLVTTTRDRTLRIWLTDSGQQIASLTGMSANGMSVVVSPDASTVLSAEPGNGNAVVGWRVPR